MSLIQNLNHTAYGLKAALFDVYRERRAALDPLIAKLATIEQSTGASETYPEADSAAAPERWVEGTSIPKEAFGTGTMSITNFIYARGVEWLRSQVLDDRTGGINGQLLRRARETGQKFGDLRLRLLHQIITAATNAALLPSVPNAYDGSAIYISTTRYGNAAGNIVTGSGITSVSLMQADIYSLIKRFRDMLDTQSRFIWSGADVDKGIMLVHGPTTEHILDLAVHSDVIQGSSAGVSNPLRKKNIETANWSEITDSDIFGFLTGVELKAMLIQEREALQETEADFSNSDAARDKHLFSIDFFERLGVGVLAPMVTVKINN